MARGSFEEEEEKKEKRRAVFELVWASRKPNLEFFSSPPLISSYLQSILILTSTFLSLYSTPSFSLLFSSLSSLTCPLSDTGRSLACAWLIPHSLARAISPSPSLSVSFSLARSRSRCCAHRNNSLTTLSLTSSPRCLSVFSFIRFCTLTHNASRSCRE